MYGSYDHVLSKEWMSDMRITHVVNCVGETVRTGRRNDAWRYAHWNNMHNPGTKPHGVTFLEWSLYNEKDRENVDIFFNFLRIVLASPATRMFVHCRDGWNLSGGMAYAIMRICFDENHRVAEGKLGARRYSTKETWKPSRQTLSEWRCFIENSFTN